MDRALIIAHGKLVAMIARLLEASGVTTTDEFARLLAVFASTVSETEPTEGEILALWAATVRASQPSSKQRH